MRQFKKETASKDAPLPAFLTRPLIKTTTIALDFTFGIFQRRFKWVTALAPIVGITTTMGKWEQLSGELCPISPRCIDPRLRAFRHRNENVAIGPVFYCARNHIENDIEWGLCLLASGVLILCEVEQVFAYLFWNYPVFC